MDRAVGIALALAGVVLLVSGFSWLQPNGAMHHTAMHHTAMRRGEASPASEAASPTRPASQSAGDWPNLFGPAHDSTSPEQGIDFDWDDRGPSELWRRTIGDGYSSPVLADNKLIVFHRQGDEEIVECLDSQTGETRWSYRQLTAYQCPMQYSSGPYSTPVIEGDRVYALGAEGKLVCLDINAGTRCWSRDLLADYQPPQRLFPVSASPLIEGDALVLNVGGSAAGSGIVAVDKRSGQTLWKVTDDAASYATARSATIHDHRYTFVFTQEGLVALDAHRGEVRWSIPFRPKNPDVHIATSPLVHGDLVLVSGFQLGSLCVRVLPAGGYEERWRDRRVLVSHYNNLIAVDGRVYGFSAQDGSFRCVDLSSGKVCWKWRSVLGRGMAIAADGHFIVLGEYGHLASLKIDPDKPRVVSMTSEPILAAPCYSAPALAGWRLFLRNEGGLICLDVRDR